MWYKMFLDKQQKSIWRNLDISKSNFSEDVHVHLLLSIHIHFKCDWKAGKIIRQSLIT